MQVCPHVSDLLPMKPFADLDAFTNDYLVNIHTNSGSVTFVISDELQTILRIIGFTHTSVIDLQTEIGYAIIFLPFQRTHITTHTVRMLLYYTLDLPSSNGIGLRHANWSNKASVRTAERMEFVFETVLK
ncbi:hypothetical protein JR316_0001689 [Psilocybe cubensis]|uniref:Uncharacterized protein n=2 Tax=Psilocybe cubensis TaxID=181762 RepID=A0A8H7Y6T1_PSICU|nr:hypothetical protein JR316_0001689 [Psilocybe cubensis]KAH9484787.1 hypothetical protein JR316_0001689 [Psilocybe cubensis]